MNMMQMSEGASVRLSGTIKWFNRSKGFGFIVPGDGMGDVFLPLAVLERSGFNEAPDGAGVVFDWAQGPKGRAVTHIVDIDVSTAVPRAPRNDRSAGENGDDDRAEAEALDGIVKWYDPARGFGFVLPNDGGKDIFVHVTTLRRSGLDGLEPGQAVMMHVVQARRGREAQSIELSGAN
jgi:CspA family cold shock protein